jgi:AmpD protein
MRIAPIWSVNGTLSRARQSHSPNRDSRPPNARINLLVIHGISLPPGQFRGSTIEKLFTNRLDHGAHESLQSLRGLRVSSHFLIRRGGTLIQFVPCDERAWHAGISSWQGRDRCNDFSIGIELEGADDIPYTRPQYRELVRLTKEIMVRYPIAEVVGHSQIAPGRKTDPGPAFSWADYRSLLETRSGGLDLPGFPVLR